MLNKLLKYNLRAVFRYLIIFYLVAISCALIGRFFRTFPDLPFAFFLREFFTGASIGLSIGAVINVATRMWEYTKRDFYGDQSYLTHTLPVTPGTLLLAKFCTTLIVTLVTLIVIGLTIFIAYASPQLSGFIHQLAIDCGSTLEFIKFAILIIGIVYLEIIFITQAGVTGIILGHRSSSHKVAKSFAYGFTIYLIANALILIFANLWGIFDPQMHDLVTSGHASNSVMTKSLIGGGLLYAIYIAATFVICKVSLEHGVDVE